METFSDMKKIVFLPCSPNMWDGLQTLWEKAVSDNGSQVTVMPIPNYRRDIDNKLDDAEYITEGYPENVPVVGVNDYNFAVEHPDIIYIQNVQDTDALGFCVHPFFHTSNLKKFTDDLTYVPYIMMDETNILNRDYLDALAPLLVPSGIYNVDHIIAPSEKMVRAYMLLMTGQSQEAHDYWESRITYDNFPRKEILKKGKDNFQMPESWASHLLNPNGSQKETILYVTSVMGVLEGNRQALKDIRRNMEAFLEKKKANNDIALIWRPYTKLSEVVDKLRPELSTELKELIAYYKDNNIGVLDDNTTPSTAIIYSDSYYGDACGVRELFMSTGKPVLDQLA